MTPSSGRLRGWLIASLLANVFLIGSVAGGVYQWSSQKRPQVVNVQHGLRQALAQLPEARRHQLRRMLRETHAQNQSLILASRQAHQDVVRRLQGDTLDRNALDQDLDRARTADITLRSRVDSTLADFAASLPADERHALALAMTTRRQSPHVEPQKQ